MRIKEGKFSVYEIDPMYLEYLSKYDKNVRKKSNRKYYGILITKEKTDYCIPFTSKVKKKNPKLTINIKNKKENLDRLNIMKKFRGYPDNGLFENFPKISEWKYLELDEKDIDNIYYIDYDYWNELSNGTSKPVEAAKVINSGREIYNVSNQPFFDGFEYNKANKFPPIILITCNNEKFLIIEGHSRMTIYGFNPSKLNGTYAYVGYTTENEMRKYDQRMLIGENVKTRKF